MRNAGLEETQVEIKIAGRNINNLRYADDTILIAESEEEVTSLLMKVKKESENCESQVVVIHASQRLWLVNKAEVDVFLELSCFFSDPVDIGNVTFCSSDFSKSSLNIWKFMVHILLKPGFENFKHHFTSM